MGITIKNLCYVLKEAKSEKTILNNISLNIESGEAITIIGRTGSGKSTLAHQISGLLMPTSGNISINGIDIKKAALSQIRKMVGISFQFPEHQLFEETVYKDIAFGLKNLGLTQSQISERIFDTIKLLQIDESVLEKSPFEISDGHKRKVAIAGILARDPEILIFDEPAAGLDVISRKNFFNLLTKLKETKNKTIIVISHNIEDVLTFSNRLIVMDHGEIISDGNIKDTFARIGDFENYGLDMPQIAILMKKLKSEFPYISDNFFDIEEAKKELLRVLKK